MISYFKYTTGHSFTLSGADYNGFINIINNKAYTGKTKTSSSSLLSSKGTFLSNSFLNKKEFDRTGQLVLESEKLQRPEISPKNLLDQTFIDKNLAILNNNNLNLFGLNIIANTQLFDFGSSSKDSSSYFLGLSSGKFDLRNDDVKLPKHNLYPLQIDPFSFIDKVEGVSILDSTIDSELVVNDDISYSYFVTTPTTNAVFSGSFVKNGSLRLISTGAFGNASQLHFDNDILYTFSRIGNTYTLHAYDMGFYRTCGNFKLLDKFIIKNPITNGPANIYDGKLKIGEHLKGYMSLVDNKKIIILSNLSNNKYYGTITTELPNESIEAFDIRSTDDSILVITSTGREPDHFNLYHIDAENLQNLGPGLAPKKVHRFNLAHQAAFHYASISNNTTTIQFSKSDSNVFWMTDKGFLSTRYISNPGFPASFITYDNCQFPPDLLFNNVREEFDDNQWKFNTNKLRSNYLNFINFLTEEKLDQIFYFYHNIGRIYLSKTKGKLNYNNLIPLDLKNLYKKAISCESGLGFSLNSELQIILLDTLTLFLNLSLIPTLSIIGGIPALNEYTTPKEVDIDFENFKFHDNEEVNYTTVSRVFNKLYNLQKTVLDSILNN